MTVQIAPAGAEFLVNSYTSENQTYSVAAALEDDAGNSLTLIDVALADLDALDFLF